MASSRPGGRILVEVVLIRTPPNGQTTDSFARSAGASASNSRRAFPSVTKKPCRAGVLMVLIDRSAGDAVDERTIASGTVRPRSRPGQQPGGGCAFGPGAGGALPRPARRGRLCRPGAPARRDGPGDVPPATVLRTR